MKLKHLAFSLALALTVLRSLRYSKIAVSTFSSKDVASEDMDKSALRSSNSIGVSSATPRMTIEEQNDWIRTIFLAADPGEQEWCIRALLEGNYWKRRVDGPDRPKGAQYSQDAILARNVFFDRHIRSGVKGFYVEAGANHHSYLSNTYLYDKCLGWDGLCVEPQRQYHDGLRRERSCRVVTECLTKERTDEMMIGGLPSHRGPGMHIEPLPSDGMVPTNKTNGRGMRIHWERISCAPLADVLLEEQGGDTADATAIDTPSKERQQSQQQQAGYQRTHVDLFVLDVEGAEIPVLDSIDWSKLSFSVIQIEDNKINKIELERDMDRRGYAAAYRTHTDTVYVPRDSLSSYPNATEAWRPEIPTQRESSGEVVFVS